MNSSAQASDRYSTATIVLHWLTLLLMVAVYACIELRVFFQRGSDLREGLRSWHFMLGIAILLLTLLRLVARIAYRTPPIQPKPPVWQIASAHSMHLALYLLLLGLPLAGWLILSAAGKPVPFFGLELPALIDKNIELAKTIREWHGTAGRIGYFLIGLHALAGLYHHYMVRDNVLGRMLPWSK